MVEHRQVTTPRFSPPNLSARLSRDTSIAPGATNNVVGMGSPSIVRHVTTHLTERPPEYASQKHSRPAASYALNGSTVEPQSTSTAVGRSSALGPAKLRNDRRELAHRVTGHRDVAEPEALATLQKKLA